MSNRTTAKIVELKTETDKYYEKVWKQVEDMGYINPSKDVEDPRSIRWTELVQVEGLEVEIVKGWDMSSFAPRSEKYYSDFQSRVNGEDDPHKWYTAFYKYEEPRKRILLGTELESLVYFAIGNERGRGHEYAINEKGFKSKCDWVKFKFPEGTPTWKIRKFANKLARIGNEEVDGTRPENKEEDLPHQLVRNFEYACEENPQILSWTLEKKKNWGRNWLITESGTIYAREEYRSFVGNVLNKAFSADRSQPLPSANTEGMRKNLWKEFFPVDDWNTMNQTQVHPGVDDSPVMLVMSAHPQAFENQMYQVWKRSGGTSRDVWLITRIGKSMDSNISSVRSVDHGRQKFIQEILEHNTSELLCRTSFPKIQKVVFEKQLSSEESFAIAYEWHPQQKRFVDKLSSSS
mgnify:CR=1 FL=1